MLAEEEAAGWAREEAGVSPRCEMRLGVDNLPA